MEEHLLAEGLDILDQALAGASAWKRPPDEYPRGAVRTTMWVAGPSCPAGARSGWSPTRPPRSRLAEVPSASPGQVDAAVEAARAALPGWRRTPAGERGELLHGVAAWLREHTDGSAG